MIIRNLWWFSAMALPLALVWLAPRVRRASLRFPTVDGLAEATQHTFSWWHRVPLWLRASALALLVVALARPQRGLEMSKQRTEGIDIVLLVDVSTSMLAEDFELQGQRRNRLDVVKAVVREFIEQRPNDRLGLVVFAGRAYTQCPLTLDHDWLTAQLHRVEIGAVEDGTAIGSGIAAGLNRLRHSTAKSRVLVLLTDGVNNAGTISPDAASQMAKALGVKMYAIGAGTKGLAPYPATGAFGEKIYQQVKIEVDDEGLTRIARTTGGEYFRATDTDSLRKTYTQIDRMEKTAVEKPQYLDYQERYVALVCAAMVVLLLELILGRLWQPTLP